jgi:uncharacterized membrane protein
MSGTDAAQERRQFSAPKYLVLLILGAMTLFVLGNNERFIIDHADPQWTYYWPVRWWLVPHGLAGAVALFLGASQFSSRLRERHLALHRLAGRTYVTAVLIAAPTSIAVSAIHNALPTFVAITVQATGWLLATGIAFYFIRHRNVRLHRQWMLRSYAITTIFLFDRVIDALPGVAPYDADNNPTVLWLCNVLAWAIPTLMITWTERGR